MSGISGTVLTIANDLCAGADCKLLYLTFFGSQLYGTSQPGKSDTDARGIFLPSLASLATLSAKQDLRHSTGDDVSRNSAEDIDISLWSLQKWLLELLPKGETAAIDLLFAPSNPDCVILRSGLLDFVFAKPDAFLNLSDSSACVQYGIRQAKKYGIKGSRLGAIKRALAWLEQNQPDPDTRLAEIVPDLIQACGDERYCNLAETASGECLQICGKFHAPGIKIREFASRMRNELNHFGSRSEDAYANAGVDYKALSHALRAADQMEELLATGRIIYPLKTREFLKRIKSGELSWEELEPLILERLEKVKKLCATRQSSYDSRFAARVILACYGLDIPDP